MADEVTISTEDGPELEDQAAHEAAVAQGAAEVHQESAEQSAEDAAAAASMAAEAAEANLESVADAVEAAATAEYAAGISVAALSGIESAIVAQSEIMSTLVAELRESRTSQVTPEPVKETPDQPPAAKGHGYYGKLRKG